MIYEVARLDDRALIRAFCNQDRVSTAYALGDLDEAFWPQSAFYGALRGDRLVALLLLYHGLEPTVMTGFGETDGMTALCEAVDLPEEAYYLWPPELIAALDAHYRRPNAKREWRMVLEPARFAPAERRSVRRLGREHADELAALYQHAADPGEEVVAFSPWQIAHGAFYGVWAGGALVATAGTHVWSAGERVAAIGNVFTQPAYRGRGYATACTAAVVVEALGAGIDPVILNVRVGNAPAIHIYEKLGFRRCCEFLEGPALKK